MFIENYITNVSELTTPTEEGKTLNKVTTGVLVTLVATISVLAFCLIWQKKQLEKQKNESCIMPLDDLFFRCNITELCFINETVDTEKENEKTTDTKETEFDKAKKCITLLSKTLKEIPNGISTSMQTDKDIQEQLETIKSAETKINDFLNKLEQMKNANKTPTKDYNTNNLQSFIPVYYNLLEEVQAVIDEINEIKITKSKEKKQSIEEKNKRLEQQKDELLIMDLYDLFTDEIIPYLLEKESSEEDVINTLKECVKSFLEKLKEIPNFISKSMKNDEGIQEQLQTIKTIEKKINNFLKNHFEKTKQDIENPKKQCIKDEIQNSNDNLNLNQEAIMEQLKEKLCDILLPAKEAIHKINQIKQKKKVINSISIIEKKVDFKKKKTQERENYERKGIGYSSNKDCFDFNKIVVASNDNQSGLNTTNTQINQINKDKLNKIQNQSSEQSKTDHIQC